jgi:hypothetical protein
VKNFFMAIIFMTAVVLLIIHYEVREQAKIKQAYFEGRRDHAAQKLLKETPAPYLLEDNNSLVKKLRNRDLRSKFAW